MNASLGNGTLFACAIAGQVIEASLLPATRGFSAPLATAGSIICFVLALYCMARLIFGGFHLSIVVPVMTCTVPLVILVIAVSVYGEAASALKIVLLVVATVMIGSASRIA